MAKPAVTKLDIDTAINSIHKKYGKSSLWHMSDKPITKIDTFPSSSLSIDIALGIGGFPRGRIIEIFGPESGGKTTLALHALAEAQKYGSAAMIDAEHALDPIYAESVGVDVDSLLISQPDTAEEALDIMLELTQSGACSCIVVDSVAALTPKAELEADMEKVTVALQARIMSKALRKLKGVANKTGTTIIFINQIREKVGIVWGNPNDTPGGRALKFYASIRIEVRKRKEIKDEKNAEFVKAINSEVRIRKNKLAPPFRIAIVRILFGKGIDKVYDVYTNGILAKAIKKSGAIFTINPKIIEDTKIKGEENTIAFLRDNPNVLNRMTKYIRIKSNEEKISSGSVSSKKGKKSAAQILKERKAKEATA